MILTLGYHIGSFCGKSLLTVYIFKTFSLTTFTLTSIVGFYGVAVYQDWLHFYYQFAILIAIGFVSGINYCSCMYWLLENKTLSKKNRELAIVITTFMNELLTFISTLVAMAIPIIVNML